MRLLWGLLALGQSAFGGVAEAERCLLVADVACARQALSGYTLQTTQASDVLYWAARTEFFAGEYETARSYLVRALELGASDPYDDLGLYARTHEVTEAFSVVKRGQMTLRYRPGLDAVLIDDALAAMNLAERHLAPIMGGPPPGQVLLEVYPHARAFTAASSLTEKDVRTTGVVALSKWSRLLLVSPRSLSGGYDWEDTIAHEYIHLVVSHHTAERAPVWLQEAIAKFLDNRWRDGTDNFHLDPRSEGLLAKAIANDGLVTFEEMHPSLAKLPTAEMAALAYAQLATLMAYGFEQGGEDLLKRLLPRVGAGEDPRLVLATECGFESLDAMQAGWRVWIAARKLQDRGIKGRPVVFGSEDALAGDPVLSGRRDLANFLRLGDLLLEREHPRAALVEYAKAVAADAQGSPLLATRVARAQMGLGEWREALLTIDTSLRDYPDDAVSHRVRGDLLRRLKRYPEAVEAYQESVAIYPYDIHCQEALLALAEQLGQPHLASRQRRLLSVLRRGGEG